MSIAMDPEGLPAGDVDGEGAARRNRKLATQMVSIAVGGERRGSCRPLL